MKLTGLTPILNVSDVPASLGWFEQLGWKREFTFNGGGMVDGAADSNADGKAEFAGISNGDCQMFLCHDGQGSRGAPPPAGYADDDNTGGVWMSWWLRTPAEVDEVHALAVKLGVAVAWPPTDEPWGVRECRIVHPDGHTFRISAPLVT
jgi:uncharacterized glyoxalase superfamily protein PhnB